VAPPHPPARAELAEVEAPTRVGRFTGSGTTRPVLLATLGVPFDDEAARVAVESAVETGKPLLIVNAVELPPLAMSVRMGYDQLPDEPGDAEAFRAPARLAASLGVEVERIRVRSPRPTTALLELVAERAPGLLVFGPDRGRLRRRAYRRAAKAVRERAACLVWLAP
jgi:nucleotide-binding universal stress UspA family protein